MIKFEEVNKEYENGVVALSDINLEIEQGEFVFLVGPSGAGKSTLMKLILKEENPTSGQIYLNYKNITSAPNRSIPYIRRSMGVVFQDFRLLENKTVFENVAFAMEIIGESPNKIQRNVPGALKLVGLEDKIHCYPNELSGGEHQRVAIARAIINNPSVLIADEPTGNLDPDTSWTIMELLDVISKTGTTILMATHAKNIVDKMKKRVVTIENGRIISDEKEGAYTYENKNID